MKRFLWMVFDENDHDLIHEPQVVMAWNLGHALQKVAVRLPSSVDSYSINVWKGYEEET